MLYNGAEIIVKLLERQEIKIIAGIPGGANLPIYDALHKSSIRHVLARHEQGAGFIAHGMARTTGQVAVCMGTSGPGSTNLLTAIADAKLDSVPIIAITGQVPTAMIGSNAFQEVDTYGLMRPITKANFFVRRAKDLFEIVPEAFRIAATGRPGPVAIDVPKDVQCEEVEFDAWPEPWRRQPSPAFDLAAIGQIAEMIHQAERPVLYVGGGVIASSAAEALTLLARKNSIPLASTLMGLGCFPPDDSLFLGMLGMHGKEYCNFVLEEADLLLALGVRFDDRATGNAKEFCLQASIVHIDIDQAEIDKNKSATFSVVGDVKQFLQALLPIIKKDSRQEWRSYIQLKKEEYSFMSEKNTNPLNPLNLIRLISELVSPDTIISTDVGQHQMWTAQTYPFRRPRTLLTSGGLGTMGFGMPAAIGAALANPQKRVICISGDGSLLMNIQELATMAEQNLPVTTIIMNNGHLGMVRQQQELFYRNRVYASKFDLRPDFTAIAKGFGVAGYDLSESRDPVKALAQLLCRPGPSVINVPIDNIENVFPIVPPGAANRDMIRES